MQAKRAEWEREHSSLDKTKIVFLDETGINTGMTRLYGRSLRGIRIIEYVPDARFERTTVLSSVRLDGTIVPVVFEGSLNGGFFKDYIKEFLVPTLTEGDIVIMDNLTSHKVAGVRELIEGKGCRVIYLPPYSPDLNPVELMWSKIKSELKKIKARTPKDLFKAIGRAFENITASNIIGWFAHTGYSVSFSNPL